MKKQLVIFVLLSLAFQCSQSLRAQVPKPQWLPKDSTFKFKPFVMMQLWGVYSMNMRVDADGDGDFELIDNRFNPHLRRARMGFRANPYPNLKFTFVAFFDGIGRDALGASLGPANNPGGTDFGVWDAFFQWKIKDSEAFNVTGGFFRPQLGRESTTSGYATTSGEKAQQQNYIRHHLVGTGPGRAAGINVGGLWLHPEQKLGLNYNLGMFHPNYTSTTFNNSIGAKWAPLWVARAVVYLGDPEMTTYKIGYQTNYYNNRNGLSIGLGTAMQGETDLFENSTTYSLDFLFNWGALNFDGEWHFMNREDERAIAASVMAPVDYSTNSGHFRASYNISVGQKILEPVFMFMQFKGRAAEREGVAVGEFTGTEETVDIGMNYYLNAHRLKLLAHYVKQEGTHGRNLWSSQGALGALPIERGDYVMVGMNAIF